MNTEDQEKILGMGEVDIYFLIDECGSFTWRMNHDMAHGRIPEESHVAVQEDINGVRELQQFAVDNLGRFNVDPESAKDRENGDYWKWYHFWDGWKKGLSSEDWDKVCDLIERKESYEKYLPKEKWNENTD